MTKEHVELIDFIDLTDDYKNIILTMRNHPEIRKWMYNSDLISTKDHFNFIKTLTTNENKKYFLVTNSQHAVGVIYFTDIDMVKKESEFGLYANFFEKRVGAGNILMQMAIEHAFNVLKLTTLKLEVFESNEKAIHLYKKLNFKQACQKTVNNHKIICMELNNENR